MKIASRFALFAAVSLLLVACGGGGTSWTFSAPAATSPAASGESPGASGSPGESPASPLPSGPSASGGQSAAPSESAAASPSGSAAASGSPGASASGGSDVIDLEGTATLQWAQNGQPIANLNVPAGRPVTFRVNNVAGFDHNFWIGDPAALSQGDTSNATGIDTWQTGVRETQYTFQAGQTLEFACTVPGHYPSMHGSFTIQP